MVVLTLTKIWNSFLRWALNPNSFFIKPIRGGINPFHLWSLIQGLIQIFIFIFISIFESVIFLFFLFFFNEALLFIQLIKCHFLWTSHKIPTILYLFDNSMSWIFFIFRFDLVEFDLLISFFQFLFLHFLRLYFLKKRW